MWAVGRDIAFPLAAGRLVYAHRRYCAQGRAGREPMEDALRAGPAGPWLNTASLTFKGAPLRSASPSATDCVRP